MSTILKQPIPTFESGYPLMVKDLDNMFNYLDEGERQSRICLLGAGIFYGLEVMVEVKEKEIVTLKISAGAGVTSQGYLYGNNNAIQFNNKKSISNYFKRFLTNTDNWMVGNSGTIASDSTVQFTDVLELDNSKENTALTTTDLKDRVVVIVFQRESEPRNGCTICNKGTNGQVHTRFLLLKKAEWDGLNQSACQNIQVKQLASKLPYLHRFGLVGTCANAFKFEGSTGLNTKYQTVVASALDRVKPALMNMVDTFATIFKREKENDVSIITKGLDKVKNNTTQNQYVYDFTKHLIQAYTELAENPIFQSIPQLPPETCFPKYLSLAHLDGQLQVQTEGVRLPFFSPPFEEASKTFQEATFLYERIMALLNPNNMTFERVSTPQQEALDIKITPSRVALPPLSNRAIPYYLDGKKMRSSWHFQLTKTNRMNTIPAYDREAGEPFNEPLLYQNAFDNADFYRIEGHVNKTLGVVWNTLVGDTRQQDIGLRTCLNLPFSVEIVEVAPHTEGVETIFTRLEEFASKHTGLEHQGGVMRGGTLILVVERPQIQIFGKAEVNERGLTLEQEPFVLPNNSTYKVIADFCLPYWVAEEPRQMALAYFTMSTEKEDKNTGIKAVKFTNRSPVNQVFEWFIDGVSVGQTTDLSSVFKFETTDKTATERNFIVTLVAKLNAADTMPDMATQGVTITREVKEKVEPPVADFQEIKRFKTTNQQEQQGELITFENRSNHATSYVWEVFEIGTEAVPTKLPVQQPINPKDSLVQFFPFTTSTGTETKKFRVLLTALSPDATPSFNNAEQEVVITRTVVEKVVRPVANFNIGQRKVTNTEGGNTKLGETISFSNKSVFAKSFLWFIDDNPKAVSNAVNLNDQPFKFDANDSTTLEKDFVVTLIAFSEEQQKGEQDVEKLTVSIRRDIKADFEIINPKDRFKGEKSISVTTTLDTYSAEFVNQSGNAAKYQWSAFDNKGNDVGAKLETTSKTNIFATKLKAGQEERYTIQLIAYDEKGNELAKCEKNIIVNLFLGSIPLPSPSEIPVSVRDIMSETPEDLPTVDGLTASRNMEARRRNFHKIIEDTSTENPPLSSQKNFQNVVDFMAELDKAVADYDRVSSLEKNFEDLEHFDKTFKNNALQLVQNIKKAGGVSDTAYRNVLRNYLFFYLDKLVHLLPDQLTLTTEQTVRDVLTKIKEEQSFPIETLNNLWQEWQVADITMMQNVPVVQQLNGLFV